MSLTVTSLARSCNLARSTVLYYESIGLRKAAETERRELPRLLRKGSRAPAPDLYLPRRRPDAGGHSFHPRCARKRCSLRAAPAADGTQRRHRAPARTPADDRAPAENNRSIQETTRGNKREIHRRFTRLRLHRRRHAPPAHRIRKQRPQRAPGVPGVPAHPGGRDPFDPRMEPREKL